MNLVSSLSQFIEKYGKEKTYWIAYSGGLDSHVLLDIARLIRETIPVKLQAIHINHGLSNKAKLWSVHCERICQQYQIKLIAKNIDIPIQKDISPEDNARRYRYKAFAEYLSTNDILLTAHHEDDQAETVLLQLMRGAGIKGLAAMPSIKSLGQGQHGRPFLAHSRKELEIYAKNNHLRWIEDESNQNLNLTRNFIRLQILPLLKARWLSATTIISRSAKHANEAQFLLDEFSVDLILQCKGSQPNTLSVDKLNRLTNAKQKLVLRTWIRKLGFIVPNAKKLETILRTILSAGFDKKPFVRWQNVEMRRFRDDIYMMNALLSHDTKQVWQWDIHQPLDIPSLGLLEALPNQKKGLLLENQKVTICFRQGGEMLAIDRRGNKTLKNLFQEWSVPPWLRDRIPLIYINNQLAMITGYYINSAFLATEDQVGYHIHFSPSVL